MMLNLGLSDEGRHALRRFEPSTVSLTPKPSNLVYDIGAGISTTTILGDTLKAVGRYSRA